MAKRSRQTRKRRARQSIKVTIKPQDTETTELDLHEYDYVIRDLRRVAIVAVAMFSLLIALSFFIR